LGPQIVRQKWITNLTQAFLILPLFWGQHRDFCQPER